MLQCYGFNQLVNEPTRRDGHILVLVISREKTEISNVLVSDIICDHHMVHFKLNIHKPPFPKVERSYGKVNTIDDTLLSSDIMCSDLVTQPAETLDLLVDQYNSVLSSVLDKHAPVKKLLALRPSAPWIK